MRHRISFILFLFFLSNLFSQQQVVLDNNVFITISNNANVVLDNANSNALLVNSTGQIISEGENNVIKWMVQNNTSNYVVPFANASFSNIPLEVNITNAGIGSNSSILFSTYETVTDKNNNYPSDVTNLNSNCQDSVGLFAIDRFWRIDAQGYSTKPTPIISFGYNNSTNELGGLNTIVESNLKAMRFNSTINSWETPQKLVGMANTNTKAVAGAIVAPIDFYKSWTLVDTSIMTIPITLNSISNTTLCQGGTVTFTPNGASSYTLLPSGSTSTTHFTITPTASVIYTITGSIGTGTAVCKNSSSNSPTVSVLVNSLPIITSSVIAVKCFGNNSGSAIALVSGSATYTWSNGSHGSFINGVSAGTYSLLVKNENGCVASHTLEVSQPNSPLSLFINANQNVLCFGQSNGFASVSANGGTPSYSYTWQPMGVLSPFASNLSVGNYTVYTSDTNGCKTNSVISITEPSEPLKLLVIDSIKAICGEANGAFLVNATGGTAFYNYQWFPVFNISAIIQNISAGSYTVLVTDANGCKDLLQLNLGCEKPIVIPQLFTPNADGKNDVFVIEGLERYPNNIVSIYNRWGNLVYSKINYQNNWDGQASKTQGNNLLPASTYFVVVEFISASLNTSGNADGIKSYSGFVELRY